MISLRDALNVIELVDNQGYPVPFKLKVVKYDEKLQKGGDFLEISKCVLHKSGKRTKSKLIEPFDEKTEIVKRNPNHSNNMTRNVRVLPSGRIRKIHIYLITRLNDERVF